MECNKHNEIFTGERGVRQLQNAHTKTTHAVPNYIRDELFHALASCYRGCDAWRFQHQYERLVHFGEQLLVRIGECKTQTERVALYWAMLPAGDSTCQHHLLKYHIECVIDEHIGSEQTVDELWEVIYFRKTDSASHLVDKYINEAHTSFQLWRIHIYLRSTGSWRGCTQIERSALKLLKLTQSDQEAELVMRRLLHRDFAYHDYVYSNAHRTSHKPNL